MRRFHSKGTLKWAGALLMIVGLTSANAVTINLHKVSSGSYDFIQTIRPGHAFNDFVRFRLTEAANAITFIDSIGLSFAGIEGFSASLQRLGQGGFHTIAHFTGTAGTFDDLLTPGKYRIALTGTAGLLGGSYRGTLHVAAVPEADTWIMLLLGAGVVLYQLRRKQRTLDQRQPLLA